MGEQKLSSPLVTVIREGFDNLTVQTDNRDQIRWDKTRIRHKDWGRMDETPNIWLTFIAWHAARRTGAIPPDVTYETWEAQVIDVSAPDKEDDDSELGRPFPEEAGPD